MTHEQILAEYVSRAVPVMGMPEWDCFPDRRRLRLCGGQVFLITQITPEGHFRYEHGASYHEALCLMESRASARIRKDHIWITRPGTHYQVVKAGGLYLASDGWSAIQGDSLVFEDYHAALIAGVETTRTTLTAKDAKGCRGGRDNEH